MILWLALSLSAWAQDGLDAHGFALVPTDGDALDLLSTWRPERQVPGALGLTGVFEYADAPLVLMREDQGAITREPLLDTVTALNLAAAVSAHERLAIGLTAPVFFTAAGLDGLGGPALGDVRLSAPIGIILPDNGFGLSAVPFLDLPTGVPTRFLGNAGLSGGGLVAAGVHGERFAATLNVGYRALPSVTFQNLTGGDKLLWALGGGVHLTDWLAARAEFSYHANLVQNAVPSTESPGEALLSLRGRHDTGLSWTAGGGFPLTEGAGAARFRAFLGLGYTFGKSERDSDRDGIVDSEDACPTEPEVVNGYRDEDGCPDALSDLLVLVVNEDGGFVQGAEILLDGARAPLNPAGQAQISGRLPGTALTALARHPHYVEPTPAEITLEEGQNVAKFELAYKPGRVRVIARSHTGEVLDARVRFEGPAAREPESLGEEGSKLFELRPGAWRLLISAASFGTERVEFEVEPGQEQAIVIEVTLHPTLTEVMQEEIQILEQVHFDFDQATIQPGSLPLLKQVANVLLDNPHLRRVEVQGHTDNIGEADYNRALSHRRVEAVRAYLIAQGVAPERLVARGYGEDQPIASNDSEQGRARNRRVQFMILDPAPSTGGRD